ncbi:MAG: TRAP transporter substrate-binding protein DctP [Deltaproteobacteria bacterium]|nr:TRAP transporter substrate-binding protein DctP [Deltaproteobacteria bacterium]
MKDKKQVKTQKDFWLIASAATLLVGLTLVILLGFNCPDAEAKAKYNFKYPSWESPNSWHNDNFYFWWPRRVEELSKGEVKFDLFPAQMLIKGFNHYEAVRDNTVTFAPSASPYEKDTLPLATVDELPFIFKDWDTYFKMHDEMLREGLQEYYNNKGVYYIAGCLVEPYGVWTTEKWGPIRKLEDLKGCKIRTPGGFLNDTLVAMGANPVAISVVDMYSSLQTGVIDGVSLAESSQISHRSHEVVKYASRVSYGCPEIHIIANLKAWNELPQNIRDIMMQAGREMLVHYSNGVEKYWKETTPVVLKKAGVELIEIAPEERRRMIEATKSVRQSWEEKYGDLEGGLGKKLLKILDKYTAE